MKYPHTKVLEKLVEMLVDNKAKRATFYASDKLVVNLTRRTFKGKIGSGNLEAMLVIGKPNFEQRKFIKCCKKAGEPFPIKKIQLKFPAKK